MEDLKNRFLESILDYYVIADVREACYLFDDLHNIVQEEFWGHCNIIQTGSFAEGMVNYNDIDKMHVSDDLVIVSSENEIPTDYKDIVLILDTSDCSPGFTKLRLLRDLPDNKFDIYTTYKGDLYLSSSKFLSVKFANREQVTSVESHGPAMMVVDNVSKRPDVDFVECFKCLSWPSTAREIVTKDKAAANEIMSAGCHVVATAHHQSKTPELDFRLSFSFAEKTFIRKWNEKQMKLYYIVKLLFKKFFSEDEFLSKGLCSYFAKTIIFWLNEFHDRAYWQETHLLILLQELFGKLKKYLDEKSMPSYFIPEYHMLSSFADKHVFDLLERLHQVSSDLFKHVLRSLQEGNNSCEMLHSIYEACVNMGENEILQNILLCISDEDFLYERDIEFAPFGGKLAFHVYVYIHAYVDEFYRFFGHHFNVSIALHKTKECRRLKKRLDKLTDNLTLYQAANVVVNRCLGYFAFSALFNYPLKKDRGRDLTLLADIEKLFSCSIHYHGCLNDGGVVGSVHFGLFYYLTGQLSKSKEILAMTANTCLQQVKQRMWGHLQRPMCIMVEKNRMLNCPRFFERDNTLCELFELLHIHVIIEFDPFVLCMYLLCMMQSDQDLHSVFTLACGEHMVCTRTNKEVDYLKYKLGLLENTENIDVYSGETKCEICDYVKRIKSKGSLNLPELPKMTR